MNEVELIRFVIARNTDKYYVQKYNVSLGHVSSFIAVCLESLFFILLPYPKNDEIVSRETLSKDRAVFFIA